MLKLGIIGTGTIFQNQISALAHCAETYRVVCVLDTDPQNMVAAGKWMKALGMDEGVCFCSSFAQFINCEFDAVLISTPPHTHFQLGIDCLEAGKHVLMEKPAALSINELKLLCDQADKNRVLFHVAYHAAFSVDIEWLLKKQDYDLGEITAVYCGFYDPYFIDGKTLEGKERLGGSYIDSGINALSVCDRVLSLQAFSTSCHTSQTDEKGTIIASSTLFSDGKKSLYIDTGWIYGLNRKRTILQFGGLGYQLVLDHTNQRIIRQAIMSREEILQSFHSQRGLKEGANNEVIFQDTSVARLERQYVGVFEDFLRVYTNECINQKASEHMHKLLLENKSL